ncbi:MAG: hypothetical protein RR916_06610 [Anaerorhabdus sp.]
MGLRERSRMAPTNLKIEKNQYLLGERFTKNLLVVQFPKEFGLGMLSYYTSNPNIKVFLTTDIIKMDISKPLNKEFKEKDSLYKRTTDEQEKQRLERELLSLQQYISDTLNNNDRTLNVTMMFSISSDNREDLISEARDLKNRLAVGGFKTETLSIQQMHILKLVNPLFIDSKMPKVMEDNIGVPITTNGVAGMWPYCFQTLKDDKGFIFAREKNNNGIILWDPMFYNTNPKVAKLTARMNANIVVVGTSGSGKTTDMNLIIRHMIREKKFVLWRDPENKNKYITKKYKGTYIEWGKKGNQINIFDLKPISVDEEEDDGNVNVWDAELAIYNVIDEFKNLIRLYKPNISDDCLDVCSELIVSLYNRFNINFQTNFKNINTDEYPVLSDFMKLLMERMEEAKSNNNQKLFDIYGKLQSMLKPMTIEHKYYFDGHTTISKNLEGRNILSFGTKILFSKSKELRNSLNYLMDKYVSAICLDESIDSASITDEGHMTILEGQSAEQEAILFRRSRKYNNVAVFGTQEPQDMASAGIAVHGKAIFNNASYKIIKKLTKDAIKSLDQLITLNESEKEVIETFLQGDALFVCGDRHMTISVLATEKEREEMDPANAKVGG